MCGIAGIIQNHGNIPLRSCLEAMSQAIKHRGPDGRGLWVSDNQRIGLAHRRLAIIDLSDEARQPMSDETKSIFVTFNGEIYNHLDLRKKLLIKGHRFRTDHSDTEVLVHGYKEWGLEGLIERLDGMFAFGIWDNNRQVLLLARDRIGIKPLYFCSHYGKFRFASEIKALLTDPSIPREMDLNAFNHYMSFMISPAPLTLFKGVFKLPAAHSMEVSLDGTFKARRYWDAMPGNSIETQKFDSLSDIGREKFCVEGIRSRFEKAVEKRLMADVPFGVFLSGGIDSSANVALMTRLMDRSVDTFTVGFKKHSDINEFQYAERISEKFNTNHHQISIDETDVMSYLDDLVHYQDEPIADWVCLPLHFVSKLAKDSGIKVVQVGEGSDEQFCGYDSWMTYLKFFKIFWNPYTRSLPRSVLKFIGDASSISTPTSRTGLAKVCEALRRAGAGHELFFSGANAIWNIHKSKYLDAKKCKTTLQYDFLTRSGFDVSGLDSFESGDVVNGYYSDFDQLKTKPDQLTRMAFSEFRLRLPELLLMRLDKITMSNSIEGRVPFLDHKLVEFSMDIPQKLKTKNGTKKYLLKKAFADLLPNDIIHRRKMGFSAPIAEWLKGRFGEVAEEKILGSSIHDKGYFHTTYIADRFYEHRAGRADHSLHLWTIFNLVSWYDHWIGNR